MSQELTNGQQQPCDYTVGADFARAIAGALDDNADAAFVYTRVRDLLNDRDDEIAALRARPEAPAAQAVEDMRERAAKVADERWEKEARRISAAPSYIARERAGVADDIRCAIRALPLGEKNDGL